jgi:uncharacterized protein (DUF1684 family)
MRIARLGIHGGFSRGLVTLGLLTFGLLVLGVAAPGGPAAPADAAEPDPEYLREIEAWHAERLARLTAPEGWLSLVGLHELTEGTVLLGSSRRCDVRLAAPAPPEIGELVVMPERVTLAPRAGLELTADGARARVNQPVELRDDTHPLPTVCRIGSLSFHVIRRGDRRFLRVKDSESRVRRTFTGIPRFPVDPALRVTARLVPPRGEATVRIANVLGQIEEQPSPGVLTFELAGRPCRLLPVGSPGEPLFLVFGDATNGATTYTGGRFLSADAPAADGTVILDFNRAVNPPCVFSPYATCPVPPPENVLEVPVRGGEKMWGEKP